MNILANWGILQMITSKTRKIFGYTTPKEKSHREIVDELNKKSKEKEATREYNNFIDGPLESTTTSSYEHHNHYNKM